MIDHLKRSELFRAGLQKPVLFPLMTTPAKLVEKENAETYMRDLLERTLAALRLP